jgi:hypothetical protein
VNLFFNKLCAFFDKTFGEILEKYVFASVKLTNFGGKLTIFYITKLRKKL